MTSIGFPLSTVVVTRLAIVVKYFYQHMNSKKSTKENLHLLLDVGGNTASKDEEKAEVRNAFFASVFNSQTDYSQDIQPPVLEGRDGEQNKPPIIQEQEVNNLLHHLDTHKSMELGGIHTIVLNVLEEELAKLRSIISNCRIESNHRIVQVGKDL